jgi:hypothetical protein
MGWWRIARGAFPWVSPRREQLFYMGVCIINRAAFSEIQCPVLVLEGAESENSVYRSRKAAP